MHKISPQDRAAELIASAGQRPTSARIRVLATLLSLTPAVTHHEVDAAIAGARMDKVTLYRVLDWLVEHGLAHKIVSDDRVWRFRANDTRAAAHHHAHFQCTTCDQVVCLENVPVTSNVAVPSGFRTEEAELTVRGVCDKCS